MPLTRPSEPRGTRPRPAGPDTPEHMLARLQSGTPEARRDAARSLAGYPQAAAALASLLGDEPAESVREAILTTLIAHHTHAAAGGLLCYLRSQDAALRNAVTEALQAMPDAIEPFIDDLLADADPDVRIVTVGILADLPAPQVVTRLQRILLGDADVNVCAAAIDALASQGDATVEPMLQEACRRFPDEPFITYATERAIGWIKGR